MNRAGLAAAFLIAGPFLMCGLVRAQNVAETAMRDAIARAMTDALVPPEFAADAPDQAPHTNPPQKPPEPFLGDLGFPTSATQPNPQEQARLNKRSHMLKIHQRLGLITTVPLIATVITGGVRRRPRQAV